MAPHGGATELVVDLHAEHEVVPAAAGRALVDLIWGMVIGIRGSPIRTKQGRAVAVSEKDGRAMTMVAEGRAAAATSEVSEFRWEARRGRKWSGGKD